MNTITFNVVAPEETLQAMKKAFPSISLSEKFSKTDWNVDITNDGAYVDRFCDWLEDNHVAYDML